MSDKNNNAREMTETQKNIYRQKIDMAMAGTDTTKKRRSAIVIMGSLIGLVKPLLHIMAAAIILGTVGYLCAIFLTILAGQVILRGLAGNAAGAGISVISEAAMKSTWLSGASVNRILAVMILMAVLRGILHYMEQYCNHFIAFKLLAIIRHKVFAALRKLCPAKLEGRDKGNLISIITTDIELLEVFYAHTISPIAIATLTSVIIVIFIGRYHVLAGVLALASYLIVGVVIPMWNGKRGSQKGMEFRTEFGELNSFVLDSLRGMDETIQYDQGKKRKGQMSDRSRKLAGMQEDLSWMEGSQRSFTNLMILLASFGMLALTIYLYGKGEIGFDGILTCTIAMMGSFGPVVALSSLSNNLNQTLASGERVLSLLEEKPLVEEILDGTEFHAVGRFNDMEKQDEPERITAGMYVKGSDSEKIENESVVEFTGAEVSHVTFAYEEETILDDYSLKLAPGKITGIHGSSGSGKSTLIKILLKEVEPTSGRVVVNDMDLVKMPRRYVPKYRRRLGVVFQDFRLLKDKTVYENVAFAQRVVVTPIKEIKKNVPAMLSLVGLAEKYKSFPRQLSGGEQQRVALARLMLKKCDVILADEPTGSLDEENADMVMNILHLLNQTGKTVVLVTHSEKIIKSESRVIKL